MLKVVLERVSRVIGRTLDPSEIANIKQMIPMARIGLPEEVARVVRFLCSEDASYVTGQVISINGGMY